MVKAVMGRPVKPELPTASLQLAMPFAVFWGYPTELKVRAMWLNQHFDMGLLCFRF